MIYLATPYSHPDPEVMKARFKQACQIAGELMLAGKVVYCPIAHTHAIAEETGIDRTWEFWERFDRPFIEVCTEVCVAKMDGWETSKGVAEEVKIARKLGKPVQYLEV